MRFGDLILIEIEVNKRPLVLTDSRRRRSLEVRAIQLIR
jgi:hypothetical protein